MPITEEFVKHLMEQNKVMAEQISQLTKTVENLNQTIQKLLENTFLSPPIRIRATYVFRMQRLSLS